MKGWEVQPLGVVCRIDKNQGHYAALPYVGLEHIESGTGRLLGTAAGDSVKSTTFSFSAEHVLYGRLRPYLNKVLLPDFAGHCSTEIFPLMPSEQLDRRFLFYWLTSESVVKAIDATSTGARMPRANMDKVLKLAVPLPSLAEQRRIVAILDEAFDAIATVKVNTEKNLNNVRAVFETYLQEVFSQRGEGWVEKRLDQLYHIGSSKRVLKSQWRTQGVPFYRGREITKLSTRGFVDNDLFISDELFMELSKQSGVPRANDIMITAIGTIGNSYIVQEGDRFYFKDASVLWMKRTTNVDSLFVDLWLKSPKFFEQLDRGNGATVDTLTIQKLQSVRLYLPSKEMQQRIASNLIGMREKTKHLESLYQEKLTALDELKKSLLHQAFTG
ncbi:MAG TPA: restriction endonuclease subunit S, partial [Ottowia sp.]|uniref:restriction endonuclease subunit S n=1 Tax=Ottowia sp. TaxID=1898956 RepID=UPI002CFBCB5F